MISRAGLTNRKGSSRASRLGWLRGMALALARTRPAGFVIREVLKHMSFAIPIERLRETETLLAFHHPSPSYPVHILLLPKQGYRSLLDLPADGGGFQRDLFAAVQSLVRELGLDKRGYRLIANGGAYQEAPILHFHLIAEQEAVE